MAQITNKTGNATINDKLIRGKVMPNRNNRTSARTKDRYIVVKIMESNHQVLLCVHKRIHAYHTNLHS